MARLVENTGGQERLFCMDERRERDKKCDVPFVLYNKYRVIKGNIKTKLLYNVFNPTNDFNIEGQSKNKK
jgi:hypothetical protein